MHEAIGIVESMRSALQGRLHCKCYDDADEARRWKIEISVYDDVIAEIKKNMREPDPWCLPVPDPYYLPRKH